MPLAKVLRAFAGLAGVMLFTQVVGFAALAIAARRLGPEALGAATFVLSVATYCGLVANFGVGVLAVRDVARDPQAASRIAGEVIVLRGALLAVAAIVLLLSAPAIAPDAPTRLLLPLATLVIVFDALSGEWTLLGLQRSAAVAAARLIGQLAYGVLVFVTLDDGLDGARQFVLYTALSVFLTVAVSQAVAWRVSGRPVLRAPLTRLRRRLLDGAPLGLAVLAIQGYLSIGAVALGYLSGTADVGQFIVAQKIPLALFGIVNLWSATIFPQAARLMQEDPIALRDQVGTFLTLNVGIALPLVIGSAFLGSELIPRLFGSEYRIAGEIFLPLMVGLAISIPTATLGGVLAATGDERRYAIAVAIGAVASVAVSIVAIPDYGPMGAAVAIIIAEILILTLLAFRYRRLIGVLALEVPRLGRIFVACLLLVAILAALPNSLDVFIQTAVAGLIYASSAVALGAVRLRQVPPS